MQSQRKPVFRIFTILYLSCLLVLSTWGNWQGIAQTRAYQIEPLTAAQLNTMDLSQTRHLMIVAHPDDETIWGGAHLQEGGYLVVCITNGRNAVRAAEFQSVMEATGNTGLMLSYPDKVNGKRDNWSQVRETLQADLELLLTCRPWEDIVTHNQNGEYGHIHHKLTYQFVTAAYDKIKLQVPLYTFGTYYTAADLPEASAALTAVPEEQLAKKEELLTLYASQARTVSAFSHMNPYEMWNQNLPS